MSRVVVAMSGGVDSSVAAALVKDAGHEAVGVTLKLTEGPATGFGCCGSPRDVEDARRVAERLSIPHYILNFNQVFERDVIDAFVGDYLRQKTPNPCVECNRSVKFGALLSLARAWSADFVATGHYARVEESGGGRRLLKAADAEKDQSYFLYSLTQKELDRALFPVGALTKPQVREEARRLGLITADKPESQEVCFVPGDYRTFVRSRAGAGAHALEPGEIRDSAGRRLGAHQGLLDYTIGQRRGLGVCSPEPLYVTRLDSGSHTLFVGPKDETLGSAFIVRRVSWTRGAPETAELGVRIRHRGRIAAARWSPVLDGVRVDLLEPQFAIAPGQAAVFYSGDEVLGGGTIEETV